MPRQCHDGCLMFKKAQGGPKCKRLLGHKCKAHGVGAHLREVRSKLSQNIEINKYTF